MPSKPRSARCRSALRSTQAPANGPLPRARTAANDAADGALGGLLRQERLDRGGGDDKRRAAVGVGDVEAALHRRDRGVPARQALGQFGAIHLLGLGHTHRHLYAHLVMRQTCGLEQRDRRMADRVFDRPRGGLGVIHAVLVVAHAHFDDEALVAHATPSRSSATELATLAVTVGLPPSPRGTSSPPLRAVTVIWP